MCKPRIFFSVFPPYLLKNFSFYFSFFSPPSFLNFFIIFFPSACLVVGGFFCAVVGDVVEGGDSVNFPVYVNEHFRVSFFVKRVWNTRKNAIFERKKCIYSFISFFLFFVSIGVSMCVSRCVSHFLVTRYVTIS